MTEHRAHRREKKLGVTRSTRKRRRRTPRPAKASSKDDGYATANTPYAAVDSRLSLQLSGDWGTAGYLEFLMDGQPTESVKLSPTLWAFMAILFKAAKDASLRHWVSAYVASKEIAEVLDQKGVAFMPSASKAHSLAHDARVVLANTKAAWQSEHSSLSEIAWAKQIIESGIKLGYRIALHPDRLNLIINGVVYRAE